MIFDLTVINYHAVLKLDDVGNPQENTDRLLGLAVRMVSAVENISLTR